MARADMSPRAVTARLVRTAQLRELCLRLGRHPPAEDARLAGAAGAHARAGGSPGPDSPGGDGGTRPSQDPPPPRSADQRAARRKR